MSSSSPLRCSSEPRDFEVAKLDLLQISDIDLVKQTFSATIFVALRVKDGALDEAFCSEGIHFPFDKNGKPTFRPSAGWYLSKLEVSNGVDWQRLDECVRVSGNDVVLCCRMKGIFGEAYELRDFPFDFQALSFAVCMYCRVGGPLPVRFTLPEGVNPYGDN